jgi:hypothetical protein
MGRGNVKKALSAGLRLAEQRSAVVASSSGGGLQAVKLFDISGVDGARRLLSHQASRGALLGERGKERRQCPSAIAFTHVHTKPDRHDRHSTTARCTQTVLLHTHCNYLHELMHVGAASRTEAPAQTSFAARGAMRELNVAALQPSDQCVVFCPLNFASSSTG